MTDRIPCCVEECRRSFKRPAEFSPDEELMCGRCFRTADIRLRLRYKQTHARSRSVLRKFRLKAVQAKPGFRRQFDVLQDLFTRANARDWRAIKADVGIKSKLKLEGTAGELLARRAA